MNTQELHDGFQTELIRRGLPADYASGAAEELADHHRDVVEELRATGLDEVAAATEAAQRLGDRRSLVKKSVREFQRRHWCGRWPLLTFLFGPLVLLIATWAATFLPLVLVGGILNAMGIDDSSNDGVVSTAEYIGMWCFTGWCVFVMPAVVLLFLSLRASRAGLNWGWIALAAVVLAVNVGSMKCGYVGKLSGPEYTNLETGEPLAHDSFVMSIPLLIFFSSFRSTANWFASNPQQVCQLLVPLVVAGLVIWRSRHMMHRWERGLSSVC